MRDGSRLVGRASVALSVLLLLSCGTAPSRPVSQVAPSSSFSCSVPPINDAGLTDAQREQAYQSAAAQQVKCYENWIATLNPATIPWSTLPHSSMMAQYVAPEGNTLSEAKAKAVAAKAKAAPSTGTASPAEPANLESAPAR